MDPESLLTASQYVNNLLLARGLLRDGVSIDFVGPAKGGHDATMASVINLVHDLVLRRDRENEHLTSLSQSVQELRTSATQSSQAASRLEAEKANLQRELSAVKSQARQSKSDLKSVESKNKAYKEDIQRLRISVGQIRAQCANDVRKRDTEIARLKKHIDVRRTRDTNSGPGGVTIIDPTTGKAHYPASMLKDDSKTSRGSSASLREETQEHLTRLCAELSENNDALVHVVQGAIATLKTLQGQSTDTAAAETQQNPSSSATQHEPAIHVADTPDVSLLSSQLTGTLSSLRALLTNPSFAPIEEVEVREQELERLRAGWEVMEGRWQEAVGLMNGWRHRMMGGDSGAISLDEIQRGIDMAEEGLSVVGSPAQRKRSRKRDGTGSEVSQRSDSGDVSMISVDSGTRAPDRGTETEDTPRVKRVRIQHPEAGTGLFPAPQILQPTCGNKRRSPSPKRISYEYEGFGNPEATPTPAQKVSEPAPSTESHEMMSPDIWVEPELSVAQKLQEARTQAQEARTSRDAGPEASQEAPKPVKRNALPRKMKSKRRSTLTPAELNGLMGVEK